MNAIIKARNLPQDFSVLQSAIQIIALCIDNGYHLGQASDAQDWGWKFREKESLVAMSRGLLQSK